ncbi:MAG: HAD family hydrolase [Planctomycetota bacterium]
MQTILFDLDGTLLDAGGMGTIGLRRALHVGFGQTMSDQPFDVPFSGRTDRAILPDILRSVDIEPSQENIGLLRREYSEAIRAFESGEQRVPVRTLPGVDELIQQLGHNSAFHLGVLTGNLPESGNAKLRLSGLFSHFKFFFFGDLDADRNDLASRAKRHLSQRLGKGAGMNLIVVGDAPGDIRCGRHVGAYVIAVCTGRYQRDELMAHQPDVVLEDLTQTSDIIQIMTRRPECQ